MLTFSDLSFVIKFSFDDSFSFRLVELAGVIYTEDRTAAADDDDDNVLLLSEYRTVSLLLFNL